MTGATSLSAKSRARSRTAFCSRVRSKSMEGEPARLHRGADVLPDEADDVLRGRAWREQLLDAQGLQGLDVLRRDDAAAEHRDILRALLAQELENAPEEVVVRAREHGEPDGVGVLLDGRGDDLFRRLVQSRVDDLEARVAERAGHDLRAAVVP